MAESKVIGIGPLKQQFGALKSGMETHTSRAMILAAGGVLKRKARAIALANGSRRTGAMIRNIAIKRDPQAAPGTVQYSLGVRSGGKPTVSGAGRVVTGADDPHYWRFVELGHKIVPRAAQSQQASLRSRRRAAASAVAAKPFIAPALEQGQGEAIEAMAAQLQKDLGKAGAA